MRTPSVSIVVPIYNGASHLRETIESLLSQSITDFELIAVGDGSKDNSVEIVRSYKDDRIRLIEQANGGLCSALNRGITEARAPYIARNDQDDLSLPGRLERQLEVMESNQEALALFAFNTKIGGKHAWSNKDKLKIQPGRVRLYEPIGDGALLGSTMFARREALRAIGGFRPEFYPADDWDLECRLSLSGPVLVVQEALVAYRFQSGANTYRVFSEMQKKTRWTRNCYERRRQGLSELSFEDFLKQEPQSASWRIQRYRKEAAKLHMRTAGQHYLDGRYLAAAGRLSAAFVLDPNDILQRVLRMQSQLK